ncbi:MAG: hypothetical protein KC482_06650 [Dehalococcoidia bacterium]|nr:hypothetical protein [Dehalococcoidia bacterium]MCA9845777.1 hypothetical protein [Dehalococcoidia bacterium]MCA9853264.1 hypothetical protein [Dehalococcoidia bacterium]
MSDMEYIIAPWVVQARNAELNRPAVRYRREWETARDAERYDHLLKQARGRLGDIARTVTV